MGRMVQCLAVLRGLQKGDEGQKVVDTLLKACLHRRGKGRGDRRGFVPEKRPPPTAQSHSTDGYAGVRQSSPTSIYRAGINTYGSTGGGGGGGVRSPLRSPPVEEVDEDELDNDNDDDYYDDDGDVIDGQNVGNLTRHAPSSAAIFGTAGGGGGIGRSDSPRLELDFAPRATRLDFDSTGGGGGGGMGMVSWWWWW